MKRHPFAFIRHGAYQQPADVPSARLPHPLSAEGEEHCLAGVRELLSLCKEHNLIINEQIHCSTLLRAYQSAEIFRSGLEKQLECTFTVHQSEELCERGLGPLANLTVSQIEDVIKKDPRFDSPPKGWKSSTNYKLPYAHAESLSMAGERVAQYLKKNLIENKLTLFIGHGASMRFAAYHLNLWDEKTAHAHSMFYAKPVLHDYDPEANRITHFAGHWKVRKPKETPKD